MNVRHRILAAMIGALLATSAAAQSSSSEPDLAYAEYQRGRYVGAFREAMRRVEEKSDPKSMTLLGEAAPTREGWWLVETASNYAGDGFSSETLQLWNADGVEVMRGLQSVAIFG